jgi:hypothetical protein
MVDGPPPIQSKIADLFFLFISSALETNVEKNGSEEKPDKKLLLFILYELL